jgi:hypothetical protein
VNAITRYRSIENHLNSLLEIAKTARNTAAARAFKLRTSQALNQDFLQSLTVVERLTEALALVREAQHPEISRAVKKAKELEPT